MRVNDNSSKTRLDRLVALARLDAAVHYFNPAVATRRSSAKSATM